jgi:hypothetical protein
MDTLPILKQNAYLTVFVKDNHLFANLAFTDFSAQKTYILSDITDLSPLKFRMDDIVFNNSFWFEYFDSLEKEFDWNIIDKQWTDTFKIVQFQSEGIGVSGVRILVDDNQPFFNKIYLSLKEFSKDIVLRIVDDKYMRVLMDDLRRRMGYKDMMWIDMDLSHFTVYRSRYVDYGSFVRSENRLGKEDFSVSKISWNNEIGLIDFIRNSKLQAFLSIESSNDEVMNKWANFVANTPDYLSDPVVIDILRAFSTVQNLSIIENNREKLGSFGREGSAVILTCKLAKLLNRRDIYLSIIDGFEMEGRFDLYLDIDNKLVTYGRNLIQESKSNEIIVIKSDVVPSASRVVIPDVPNRARAKVVFSGKLMSQGFEQRDVYAFNPSIEVITIPDPIEKVVIDGELRNGCVLSHYTSNQISFVSSYGGIKYDSLVIDCRMKPAIYGPKASDNKIKLQNWRDGSKE